MNDSPIVFSWTEEGVMRPRPMFMARCDKEFVVGCRYALVQHEERSTATHRHFFACVNDAFKNLPEDLAGRFQTAEHLRKWSLIKCGYCDERTVVFSTPADARRAAAFVTSMDDYAVILVRGTVLSIYTAKSQSARSMNKQEFQASKRDVLDLVAEMIGVSAATLAAQSQDHQDLTDDEPAPEPVAEKPQTEQAASAPAEAAGEPGASEAPGQGGEASGAPRKAGGRPRGSKNKPKGDAVPEQSAHPEEHRTETPTEAEVAQGRGALGDDPDKPQTPAGEVAESGPALPKNSAEYEAYALAYIAAATSAEVLDKRWRAERDLRTDCMVISDEFQRCFDAYKAKSVALKGEGKL